MSSQPECGAASELETRCAWLSAMGIPMWLPRAPLPGGPEAQSTWRLKTRQKTQAPGGNALPASAQAAIPAGDFQAPSDPSRRQAVAAMFETISSPEPTAAPVQGQQPQPDLAGSVPATSRTPAVHMDRPIRIGIDVRIGAGWMLLAEHGSGYWGERERLFTADLMYACCGEAEASSRGPTFHWPPSEADRLAARGDLARDALAGFIEKCAADCALHTMLCLGSSLSDWLIQARKPERIVLRGLPDNVRRIALPGVRELLAQPDSKRHVWRTLSDLAHGS